MLKFTIGDPEAFDLMCDSTLPIWKGPWVHVTTGRPVSHAVLIVGLSEKSEYCVEPHLIIQNSWGDKGPNNVSQLLLLQLVCTVASRLYGCSLVPRSIMCRVSFTYQPQSCITSATKFMVFYVVKRSLLCLSAFAV